MANEVKKSIKIPCSQCGGGDRNHIVLFEQAIGECDDDCGIWWETNYQMCQCQGCDEIRLRTVSSHSEDFDFDAKGEMFLVKTFKVYPESKEHVRKVNDDLRALVKVGRIYGETITALNNGANILAGGGLRAIVEAICIDRKVAGGSLAAKIDALVQLGMLAKPQADLLHEERYLGNSALHEVEPPSQKDLLLGLDIVEGLLNTIYILPEKARRMQQARMKKTSAAAPQPVGTP